VIRLLNVVDEFTREALAMLVERSIDADRTVGVLGRLVAERGVPEHIRMEYVPGHIFHLLCPNELCGRGMMRPVVTVVGVVVASRSGT
jgi:hypothetical protein